MSIVNLDVITPNNLRLAKTINDLAEILMRESSLHIEYINENLKYMENKEMTQLDILNKLYTNLLDKLKKVFIDN
jgi:hypothetical protein